MQIIKLVTTSPVALQKDDVIGSVHSLVYPLSFPIVLKKDNAIGSLVYVADTGRKRHSKWANSISYISRMQKSLHADFLCPFMNSRTPCTVNFRATPTGSRCLNLSTLMFVFYQSCVYHILYPLATSSISKRIMRLPISTVTRSISNI